MNKFIIITLLALSQVSFSIDFEKTTTVNNKKYYGISSFGDLNNDGYKDIFISAYYHFDCDFFSCQNRLTINSAAKVLINDTRGGFVEKPQFSGFGELTLDPVDLQPSMWEKVNSYRSTIADVNNDELNDIITSDGRVFINSGEGQFLPAIKPGIGSSRKAVFTVDFDNDGILEIVNDQYINRRNGTNPLTYSKNQNFPIGSKKDIKFADFNNDSYLDILTYGVTSQIVIYLNNQEGGFSLSDKVELGHIETKHLEVGDINNDSFVDIVLSDGSIIKNKGSLQFENVNNSIDINADYRDEFDDAYAYYPMKLMHFNNDEFLDLVVSTHDIDGFFSHQYVLTNDGSGQFSLSENLYNSYVGAVNFFIEDFTNDGTEDFLKTEYYSPTLIENNNDANPVINSIIDPARNIPLNLFITNREHGYMTAALAYRFGLTNFMPFDVNGDGVNEFLSTTGDCIRYEVFVTDENCSEYKPFYLSNVKPTGYEIYDFEFLTNSLKLYNFIGKEDFNNDGLEDLLISYTECEEMCDTEKTMVFLNSESGLSAANTLEYDIGVNGTITDLDGNGVFEVTRFLNDLEGEDGDVIITELQPNGEFVRQDLMTDLHKSFGTHGYADINNDGKTDVLYLNSQKQLMISYGDNALSNFSVPVKLTSNLASEFILKDLNSDGFTDILTRDNNRIIQYENNGIEGTSLSAKILQFNSGVTGDSFYVADITGDGFDEIIIKGWPATKVFQDYNNNEFKLIHEFFPGTTFIDYNLPINFIDMDNDNKADILSGNEIYFSRDFNFHPGLNYDSAYNGHGFSIENVAEDQFFTVFYTYDNQGQPEWYSGLGLFEEPTNDYWFIGTQLYKPIKTFYDFDAQSFYQNNDSSNIGTIRHDSCSETFGQFDITYAIGINNFGGALESDDWCSGPLVDYYNRPKTNDMSGLWWAGSDDAGWGWSVELIEKDDQVDMVVILYYYDGDGQPRWLIGQQSDFEAGQEITLDMSMIKGYGRSAVSTEAEFFPAGTMSLTLNQASSNILSAGSMSIDVSYPGEEGGRWVRDNIPIAQFSTAR